MSSKIPISVISAAYRNWMYRSCCASLFANANVPFEIIFVGPNPPTESMPNNFRYIQTNVKPSQCLEIAARNAVGEYLFNVGDDVRFSNGFLDRLYNYTLRLDADQTLITFRYSHSGKVRDGQLALHLDVMTSYCLGLAGCFRRDLWNQLGGIDSRWVGSYGDIDMQMRFYEYGMHPFIAPDCIMDEAPVCKKLDKQFTLYYRCGKTSRDLFEKLWAEESRRSLPVEPFDDKDILSKNQGESVSAGKRGAFTYV